MDALETAEARGVEKGKAEGMAEGELRKAHAMAKKMLLKKRPLKEIA